ncbi:MAG: HAD hydrolase-like protein [Spirochaetales bacterium]|nr:HAD hydrolase-like protein [Spirochaetales bacterium]
MNFDCLIFDHDDTCVDSTASVHYPAHVEVMKQMRPNEPVISLHTWFEKNFHPGIMAFLTQELGLTKEEMDEEYRIWQEFNAEKNPPFYPGIPELMERFVQQGGIIAVVSHSVDSHIRRHYAAGAPNITPQFIFGWEHEEEKRKPSPYPVQQILAATGASPHRTLVIDDLRPGIDMARAAGVQAAAAGWGHSIPAIQNTMREICDHYLPDIPSLERLIFEEQL